MEAEIEQLKNQIKEIQKRNELVELDKAWETSMFRRVAIAILTYIAISIYMRLIEVDRPLINAIVPTFGFLLSTLTLEFFKKNWVKKNIEK